MLSEFGGGVVAHVGDPTRLPPSLRLFIAAIAGFGAAAITTIVMDALAEGWTPIRYAAAFLSGDPPEAIASQTEQLLFYAVGTVLGILFEALIVGYERVRTLIVVFVNILTLGDLAAAALVVLFLYVSLAYTVVSRYGDDDSRPTGDGGANDATVRRHWGAVSLLYGVALLVTIPTVYALVPTAG